MDILQKLTQLTKDGKLVWKLIPGNHLYLNLDKYFGKVGGFKVIIERGYDYLNHDTPNYNVTVSLLGRVVYGEEYYDSSYMKDLIEEIELGRFGTNLATTRIMEEFLKI